MTVTMTSSSTRIQAAKSILQVLLLNHRDFHHRSCMNVLKANGDFHPKTKRGNLLKTNLKNLSIQWRLTSIFRFKSEHNYSEQKRQKNAPFVDDVEKQGALYIQMLRLHCSLPPIKISVYVPERRSLVLILFSWGQGTLSPDVCLFTSVLPACHCVRRDSYLASIASNVAL